MKTTLFAAALLFSLDCAQNQSAPPAASPTGDVTGHPVEPGATNVNSPANAGEGAGASGAETPGAATNMNATTKSGTGSVATGSPVGESRDSRVNSEVATEVDPRKDDTPTLDGSDKTNTTKVKKTKKK